MNTLRNKVNLIGNLGMDPEIKEFEAGKKLARFTLATHEPYKNKKGEWVENTQWHNIIAWDKTAELCEKILKKGAEIAIEGRIENDTYTTKDGEKRHSTKINLREFMAINRMKNKAS